MNDWSRLAVDPTRCKNSGPKNELHQYKYAPDKAAKGASCQEAWSFKAALGRAARDNSVCPLTNTYHECRRFYCTASLAVIYLVLRALFGQTKRYTAG